MLSGNLHELWENGYDSYCQTLVDFTEYDRQGNGLAVGTIGCHTP